MPTYYTYPAQFDVNGVLLATQIPDPVVIVQPTVEPVTLTETKVHLRLDSDLTATDSEITRLIKGGRQFVERQCGLALIDQTLELRLSGYPANNAIKLRGPLLSSVFFKYTDADGALQDVDADHYVVEGGVRNRYPRIVPAYGVTWPTDLGQSDTVRVQWRAGFADRTGSPTESVELVPENLRTAILFHVEAHYYRDEKMMQKLIDAAVALCNLEASVLGVA